MHTSGESANLHAQQGEAQSGDQDLDIPADTFPLRLVVARHHAGRLSIEQAAARCGLNSENWRRWEDGAKPRDQILVCQAVSEGLSVDLNWVMFGGPLSSPRGRPTKRVVLDTDEYLRGAERPRVHSANRPPEGRPKVRTDSRGSTSHTTIGRRAVPVR